MHPSNHSREKSWASECPCGSALTINVTACLILFSNTSCIKEQVAKNEFVMKKIFGYFYNRLKPGRLFCFTLYFQQSHFVRSSSNYFSPIVNVKVITISFQIKTVDQWCANEVRWGKQNRYGCWNSVLLGSAPPWWNLYINGWQHLLTVVWRTCVFVQEGESLCWLLYIT